MTPKKIVIVRQCNRCFIPRNCHTTRCPNCRCMEFTVIKRRVKRASGK